MILTSQVLLWVAVVVLAVLVAALARQVGILHERIAPAGALTLHQRLQVGDRPEPQALVAQDGTRLTIGGTRAGAQLVFFAAPDCPVCKVLLPVLRSVAKDEGGGSEGGGLELVLAGDGDAGAYRAMAAEHGLGAVPLVLSEALGRTFGVAKLPYAVLLDEAGRLAAMGLVNNREHLESLFAAREHGVASFQEFRARKLAHSEGGA